MILRQSEQYALAMTRHAALDWQREGTTYFSTNGHSHRYVIESPLPGIAGQNWPGPPGSFILNAKPHGASDYKVWDALSHHPSLEEAQAAAERHNDLVT